MGFLSDVVGGFANFGSSALSAYVGWKHQKEAMQNRHQWEVSDASDRKSTRLNSSHRT